MQIIIIVILYSQIINVNNFSMGSRGFGLLALRSDPCLELCQWQWQIKRAMGAYIFSGIYTYI